MGGTQNKTNNFWWNKIDKIIDYIHKDDEIKAITEKYSTKFVMNKSFENRFPDTNFAEEIPIFGSNTYVCFAKLNIAETISSNTKMLITNKAVYMGIMSKNEISGKWQPISKKYKLNNNTTITYRKNEAIPNVNTFKIENIYEEEQKVTEIIWFDVVCSEELAQQLINTVVLAISNLNGTVQAKIEFKSEQKRQKLYFTNVRKDKISSKILSETIKIVFSIIIAAFICVFMQFGTAYSIYTQTEGFTKEYKIDIENKEGTNEVSLDKEDLVKKHMENNFVEPIKFAITVFVIGLLLAIIKGTDEKQEKFIFTLYRIIAFSLGILGILAFNIEIRYFIAGKEISLFWIILSYITVTFAVYMVITAVIKMMKKLTAKETPLLVAVTNLTTIVILISTIIGVWVAVVK